MSILAEHEEKAERTGPRRLWTAADLPGLPERLPTGRAKPEQWGGELAAGSASDNFRLEGR